MLVSLTVGKVDAGVAVLLTHDNRLIEFPSVLLPNNITSGSIVDITVSRNQAAETSNVVEFQSLQKRILNTYGINAPSPPILRLKNATQTSLVLEWDPINLATASLKSLSLYRNGSKAGSIPRPLEMLSTKISGLAIDTEYTFFLVLRTSAGTYTSEKLDCRTHKMTDLSGITVTPGVLPENLKSSLGDAVQRIGAKMIDTVRIDTTHFVCTEGRGAAWEKAVEMNIPVVRPEWVEGCEREGTIVSVRGYYLNADPKLRQIGPGVGAQQNRQNAVLPSNNGSTKQKTRPSSLSASSQKQSNSSHEPPMTPFPGGPASEVPNGLKQSEDEARTPPALPPKDENEKEQEPPSPAPPESGNDIHTVEQEKQETEHETNEDETEASKNGPGEGFEEQSNATLEKQISNSSDQRDTRPNGKTYGKPRREPSRSPSPNPFNPKDRPNGKTPEEADMEEVKL